MIAGILLAAGAGTRFGGRKLLHRLPDGVAVGVAALRNLKTAVPQSCVVIRPGEMELRVLFGAEGVPVIECAEAELGMGHSLAAAVAHTADAEGWIIALGDMPSIRPSTIARVARALQDGAALVLPMFDGQRGHPVGLSRRFREELLALRGDAGARAIVQANPNAALRLECDDPGILLDIDTPADAARLTKP